MSQGETPEPEPIEGTIEVRTRVLADRREPEPTVSRVLGPLAPTRAGRPGVEIACTTSFAARRAAHAEAGQGEGGPEGVLGRSSPPRGGEAAEARVNVRVASVDERE